jgi:hypothetical protein
MTRENTQPYYTTSSVISSMYYTGVRTAGLNLSKQTILNNIFEDRLEKKMTYSIKIHSRITQLSV